MKKVSSNAIKLSSNKFSEMLGHGFIPGVVYLIYGGFASGKTQICLHSCVSLHSANKDAKQPISALFIDTEDTFRPERILEIGTQSYNLDEKELLSRILVLKAESTDMIYSVLKKFDSEGVEKGIKLIIIDSLTNYVRVDLGNEEKSSIQVREKLKRILEYIREITKNNNIITILTSQVTGFTSEDAIYPERPIMEYVLNHYVDEVIFLQKIEDTRWGHIVNSRELPNQKIPFNISEAGIIDVEEG